MKPVFFYEFLHEAIKKNEKPKADDKKCKYNNYKKHKFVTDLFDVDVEKSLNFTYCELCGFTV